ncbi:MAG TPA: hypothetical protein VHC39_19835 [Rhizomicrobium sp.]|nr:hypothetical protein [Rhizomicrobium sp.]
MRLSLIAAASLFLVVPAIAQHVPDRTNSRNPSMGDLSNQASTTLGAETTGAEHGDMHFRDNAHPGREARRDARDARQDARAKAAEQTEDR